MRGRAAQYLVLGGGILLLQADFVKRTLQSSSFQTVVAGTVAVLLVLAVAVMVMAEKRNKNRDGGSDA